MNAKKGKGSIRESINELRCEVSEKMDHVYQKLVSSKTGQFIVNHPVLVTYAAAFLLFALKAYIDKEFNHGFLDMFPNSPHAHGQVIVDNSQTMDVHQTGNWDIRMDSLQDPDGDGKFQCVREAYRGIDTNNDGLTDIVECVNSPYDVDHNGLLEGAEKVAFMKDYFGP